MHVGGWWWAAASLTFLLGTRPAGGQAPMTLDTLSLVGLPGVFVSVAPLPSEAERDGLVTDSLRWMIEAALREGGVRVLSQAEWQVIFGNPMLWLGVHLVHPSPHFYLYSIELELRQLTSIPRDSMPAFGATWAAEDVVGTVPTVRLPTLRKHVRRLVNTFIGAWAAAQRYPHPLRRSRGPGGAESNPPPGRGGGPGAAAAPPHRGQKS